MAKKGQRVFDQAFKREAVRLTETSGKSMTQIARDLGVSDSALHAWRKQFAQHGDQAFPGKVHHTELEEENRRLRRENELLKQEREVLKKTRTAFFSGRAVPPEHVSNVRGLSESDAVHVELQVDSQLAF